MPQRRTPHPQGTSATLGWRIGWPLIALGLLALSACRRDVREWRAEDHDDEPQGQLAPTQTSAEGKTKSAGSATEAQNREALRVLVETTWGQRCALCHGPSGRGDGPNGPMLKTPNLTNLTAPSEADVIHVIRSGRGAMPAFAELPEAVVRGLAQRIITWSTSRRGGT